MKTFYTYLWLREDGTPYYVGKGTGNRAFIPDYHSVPVPSRDMMLIQEYLCEAAALEAEKFLIAYYGRKDLGTGCLRNLTDGGDGISGYKYSEAQRDKLRQRMLGNHHTLGMTLSPEFCKKQSERLKGNTYSLGYKHNEEARRHMSEGQKGRMAWNKGKSLSIEHRLKIAATLKGGTTPFKGKPWTEARRAAQEMKRAAAQS